MNLESQDKIIRNKDKGNAFYRYYKSLLHAIDGIIYSIKYEHNMIIIVLAMFVVTIAGFFFSLNAYEWLFCITVMGLVCGAELINTAIEALVDLCTTEYHPLAKTAKDCASSASLIFSITAFIGGLIIFIPKIIEMFF